MSDVSLSGKAAVQSASLPFPTDANYFSLYIPNSFSYNLPDNCGCGELITITKDFPV